MHKRSLIKPDGRPLELYARAPIDEAIVATAPASQGMPANPHLRWHPLRGEWVAYASHRQDRTFLPPKEFNPLLPTKSADFPTELPAGDYDIAVFANLFPTLSPDAHAPPVLEVPTRPGTGVCEVVVYSQDPETSVARLPLDHLELLIEVWGERYATLGARPDISYVMAFENRGVEMGVTLHHPHGQIYAYPFVPPLPAREVAHNDEHFERYGQSVLQRLMSAASNAARTIYDGRDVVAFVPVCARYSYEVWIAPRERRASIADLDAAERRDFARALKTVTLKYDNLWQRPFPYLMVLHQAPTDGVLRPGAHFHAEFSPPYRSPGRLKYLAGTELGAGMFANDSLPEEKARELIAVVAEIE